MTGGSKPSLEERLRHLEDLEEIRNLKHLYCRYADIWGAPGNAEAFSRLFAEDGDLDVGAGFFVGAKGIAEGLRNMSLIWARCFHLAINPRIDIDGDHATGEWYGLLPLAKTEQSEPAWVCGVYKEEYVRTVGGWRFKHVRFEIGIKPSAFVKAYE